MLTGKLSKSAGRVSAERHHQNFKASQLLNQSNLEESFDRVPYFLERDAMPRTWLSHVQPFTTALVPCLILLYNFK